MLHSPSWLATVSAFVIFTFSYYNLNQQFHDGRKSDAERYVTEKENWIRTAVESPVEGEFNGEALRDLCDKTKWLPGLVMSCSGIDGGFGNVRNELLNCVRYSIEAGGGFIVPSFNKRSQYNLAKLTTDSMVQFTDFFDRQYFKSVMNEYCPQMTVYDDLDSVWDIPSLGTPIGLEPHMLASVRKYNVMVYEPQKWRSAFETWLGAHLKKPQFAAQRHVLDARTPVRIELGRSLFTFPTWYDTEAFRANFGLLLKIRPDIQRLAANVVHNLDQRFNLSMDPSKGIQTGKYMAAHLRTDSDVSRVGWRPYEFQQEQYIKQTLSEEIQVMYIASGDSIATDNLRFEASRKFGIHVIDKYDLLAGPELVELKSLAWDQQGLVDFLVCLRSSTFGGIEQSSFAWTLALRRQLLSQVSLNDALSSSDPLLPWTLVDELSTIYGGVGSWKWFVETMWP